MIPTSSPPRNSNTLNSLPMTATEAPARGDRSGPLGLRTTADRKDRLLEGRSSGLVLADPSTGPLGGRRVGAGIIPDTAPSKSLAAYAVAFRAAGLDLLTSFRANPFAPSLRARWLAPLHPPSSGFSPALPPLHDRMIVPFFEFFDSSGRKWRMVEWN